MLQIWTHVKTSCVNQKKHDQRWQEWNGAMFSDTHQNKGPNIKMKYKPLKPSYLNAKQMLLPLGSAWLCSAVYLCDKEERAWLLYLEYSVIGSEASVLSRASGADVVNVDATVQ